MNVNTKVLALMAALAAGSAGAAYTQAGTTITNTATATFSDPSSTSGATLTSTSNTVSTTVLAKPDFDIIFKGGSPADGGTQNALSTTTRVLTGDPGATFPSVYTVKNDGNIELIVNLSANSTGASTGQTVAYYLADASGNRTGSPITTVTIPYDNPSTTVDEGLVDIVQVVTAGTVSNGVYGASPEGTVSGIGTDVGQNGYASGSTNHEQAKTAGSDLQFTKVLLYSLASSPNPTATPTNPITPGGATYSPAPVGSVETPILAPGNTDTTLDTPPTGPATGYTDPGGTPIVPNGTNNNQIAYPKADADNNADLVTFTNALTNTGSAADRVQLFPVDAVNADGTLKSGYSFNASTGTFTLPGGVTVQFLDPGTGAAISTPSGSLFPTFDLPAGSTVYYLTRVTYPDADDSTPIAAITVAIGADSLNDADTSPNVTTSDIIYPAAAQFGDSTAALGAVNTPAPVQTVTPYGNYGTPTGSPDASDGTAVFPMDVVNVGQYNDSFKLGASVPGMTGAVVRFFDAATGAELTKDSGGAYVTPVVATNAEYKVLAVVDVPLGTATGNYTVSQNATGNYSTIAMSDTNNVITVAKPGSVNIAKFIARSGAAGATHDTLSSGAGYVLADAANPTTARPLDTISYRIMAKNNYPMAIASFLLSDVIPANTSYASASVSGVSTAKVVFKASDTGSWTATPGSTVYAVAVDINGDGAISAADSLPSGGALTLDLNVTVK